MHESNKQSLLEFCKEQVQKANMASAVMSKDRKYRYSLFRMWDNSKTTCVFIGLNPSTADDYTDDPTIRRCINFAKAWGYGGLHMLNLFAFRATDPKQLKTADDPVGEYNDRHIESYSKEAPIVIAAWGVHGSFLNRDKQVISMICNLKLKCLGKTKDGHPRHPLYLPKTSTPIPL